MPTQRPPRTLRMLGAERRVFHRGRDKETALATKAVGSAHGPRAGRRRVACGAALLLATAWTVGGGRPGTLVFDAPPRASAADPPGLRSIAHAGGDMNGLAVDGDVVYIGEGPDVVALRLDAEARLTVVHRTPLPEVVTSLAIAPEADRLYAAAGDAVYAIAIADGQPPALIDGVAVPLQRDGNIVARGDTVYARLDWLSRGQERCIAAVSFAGTPARGAVGPPACATDIPADGWADNDRLTLGDGVLAAYAGPYSFDRAPDIALFDVREPSKPRFRRSLDFDDDVLQAEVAGTRLWVMDEEGRSARSYDVANLDQDPAEVAEATLPYRNRIERMFKAEGRIWLVADTSILAFDPHATGTPQPTKVRWIAGYSTASLPGGWMAATASALLVLDTHLLSAFGIPADDAHFVGEPASWYGGDATIGRVVAVGGRTFAPMIGGLTQFVHAWPTALVRLGSIRFPPIDGAGGTQHVDVRAFDADLKHLVGMQSERLAMVRLPLDGPPMLAAKWTIPPAANATDSSALAVRVAAGRAVVLRPADLFVVDLGRPEAPVAHIAHPWQSARTLALGPAWAAVLTGGYDRDKRTWAAPHVGIVDVRSSPPAVLGELTLSDRVGWNPVRIARDGNTLVVALSRPAGGTRAAPVRRAGEVVVIGVTDPTAPLDVGRLPIEDDAGVDLSALAAADGLAIVGGMAKPTPDPGSVSDWRPPWDRGRLWEVDIADPAQPVVRAAHDMPGQPHDIAIDGRAVLVAAGDGGLQRFDLVLPGDVPAPIWRLSLPWLASGERFVRGQPIPVRATARPMPTTAP